MIRKTICACLLCCFALTLSGCRKKEPEADEGKNQVQIQHLDRVLDYLALSAHFLIDQQQPDGFFKYEYDFVTGSYSYWDNIIHQTRAGYTLIMYYSFLVKNNIDSRSAGTVLASVQKALQGYASASVAHDGMPGKLVFFYHNKTGYFVPDTPKPSADLKNQRLEAEIAATAFALITELHYWSYTSDPSFIDAREQWREALIYHTRKALDNPVRKSPFMTYLWQVFAVYSQLNPSDKEVGDLLLKLDAYFTVSPRYMNDIEDYTWDMLIANQRYRMTQQTSFIDFAARQTTKLLEGMYTQHDTTVNSCALSLGLAEAAIILNGKSGDYTRIERTALGRSLLEYYSSLKYTILPNQAWIALGPGRTLHSQEFKRFAGAIVFGMHMPRTNIGLVEMCLLTGMRFSHEDIEELKQKTGKE